MGLLRGGRLQFGIFIIVACLLMSAVVVQGDNVYYKEILFENGESVDDWHNVSNQIRSAGSLSEGPGSGYGGGRFMYFTSSGGSRVISEGKAYRDYPLTGDLKKVSEKGYLAVKLQCAYYGWDDGDTDHANIYIQSINSAGQTMTSDRAVYCDGGRYWSYNNWGTVINVDSGAQSIRVWIEAKKNTRQDMDVYLDEIKLIFYDTHAPSISGIAVNGAADKDGKPVQAVGGTMWLNNTDTIKGKISFNEYVSVPTLTNNIRTNMVDIHNNNNSLYGSLGYEGMPVSGGFSTVYLTEHDFKIGLGGADYTVEADGKIEISYLNNSPFNVQVKDYAARTSINDGTKHYLNNTNLTLKLDGVAPEIITPVNFFGTYVKNRGAVDVIVGEKDNNKAQSPLTVSYYWEYKDNAGMIKKTSEQNIESSSLIVNGSNGNYTHTYRAVIGLPVLSEDIRYQDMMLYVKASDAARNKAGSLTPELGTGDYTKYAVKGTDDSAPELAWSKTRNFSRSALPYSGDNENKYIYHEERDSYTEVAISNTSEDASYAKGRHVYFSISEPESGIREVRYLWTNAPYTGIYAGTAVLDAEQDGVYMVEGAYRDNLTEGTYYLNILSKNITGTYKIYNKAFKFDNQAPADSSGFGASLINMESVNFKVTDKNMGDRFLYAFAEYDNDSNTYGTIPAPNLLEGFVAQGDWKLAAFSGTDGPAKTAAIDIPAEKTGATGRYKLIARFYDEFRHFVISEVELIYDRTPPTMEVLDIDDASVYKKNRSVVLRLNDNRPMASLDIKEISWIIDKTDTEIAASYTTYGQQVTAADGTGTLNGSYLLKVVAKDAMGNEMTNYASDENGEIFFKFDNSAPLVDLAYDTANPVREISFNYSGLIDPLPIGDISTVETFRYGISDSPAGAPNMWFDIGIDPSAGSVTHPEVYFTGEAKYVYISISDVLGNVSDIAPIGPFRIDREAPDGRISFEGGYVNKDYALLKLEVDELKSVEKEAFKIAVSSDSSTLESPEIYNAGNAIWENMVFENGIFNRSINFADTTDGIKRIYARFMDAAGNVSEIYQASVILDKIPPTGSIAYDVTVPTKGNVTASLTIEDDNTVTVLNNNNSDTYVFNRNGEFEFIIEDAAGNKAHINAAVDNIDNESPKATVSYSQPRDKWTNKSVTATLALEDANECSVSSPGGYNHTFDENGEFTFEYADALGNSGSIIAVVDNIDKEAPIGHIISTYSDTAPVTVYLAVYESVDVTSEGGSFRHIFGVNDDFTFEFVDKAGNAGQATASVSSITSENKYVDVAYNDTGILTNDTVQVEFTAFSGISSITSPTVTEEVYGTYSYSFEENGDKPVYIRVLSEAEKGSIRTVTGSVYNIDKTPPEAVVYISTEAVTNQSVTATLLPWDDRGNTISILNNDGNSTYTFIENGSFTFAFEDEAGNIGYKEITVDNIDKTAPVGKVRYLEDTTGGESKFAELYFEGKPEAVTILNNNGSSLHEFVENGEFTFFYADAAGNTGVTVARVTSFLDGTMTGSIEYYIDDVLVPSLSTTNKSVIAKLVVDNRGRPYSIVNNEGKDLYTFMQNGEFTFIFEDTASGNRGFASAKIDCIDKEAPELTILADTLEATNKDVTITVNYSDANGIKEVRHNMESDNLTSEPGSFTFICKENKTIQVTAVDNIGNEITKELMVDYIDRTPPTGAIVYTPGSLTNQNVNAVLVIDEQGHVTNNNNRTEYIFTKNGEFIFEFRDNAGNTASKTASVNWIDKVPPIVELEYSSKEMTNQPVEVTVRANKPITVQNNGGEAKRIFYENGEYSFKVADAAGNLVVINAEVENIDTEAPIITLNGPHYLCLLQDEAYTEQGFSAADNVYGDATAGVAVEGSVNTGVPGVYILKYRVSDPLGNQSEVSRTVKVIGKNEFAFNINGTVTDAAQLILNSTSVRIKGMGNEGSYIIKWTKGTKTEAYFKSQGNTALPDEAIVLENNSWNTFFMQDRERKTKLMHIYISE